ncbi:MAG TPA: hypothetical protein VJ904_04295 [Tichowtungia sp.]|nr:hypothetical protein [Tichowtungia sp.]
MKRWIAALLIGFFAAGISLADESVPERKNGPDRSERRMERRRPRFSQEQREKMKAQYEAIRKLAEAIRSETDPVKKEELTNQLREKLTEGAKQMQARFRKRIEQAEKELGKMKERLKKGEAEMAQRVEEKLQKILDGEHPVRRDGSEKKRRPKGPPSQTQPAE